MYVFVQCVRCVCVRYVYTECTIFYRVKEGLLSNVSTLIPVSSTECCSASICFFFSSRPGEESTTVDLVK